MQTKTISINRGLRELKTLDARITKAINEGTYVVSAKNTATKISGMTREDLKTEMKASYDKVVDLMTYRDALKSAIIASNAITDITIGDKTVKVAEAIYMKDSMDTQLTFLHRLTRDFNHAKATVQNGNDKLEKNFELYITQMFGGKDKIDATEVEKHRKQFYDNNGFDIIDPLQLDGIIKTIEEEIVEFMDEVDATLTDSNALTTIVVEW